MRWSTSLVSVSGAMACLAACNPTNAATTTTRGPSSPVANPSVAVTPDTGLTDSQSVTITGSGYQPKEHLTVLECGGTDVVQTGKPIGGDCATFEDKNISASARDAESTAFVVYKGPIGGNYVDCTKAPGCVVSVLQESTARPLAFAMVAFTG